MKYVLSWLLTLEAFLLCVAKEQNTCFSDAKSELKDLVNQAENKSYPVGVWTTADYPAAHMAASIIQIMIKEKLGYNVAMTGMGGISQDAFFALTGCSTPTDANNRGCSGAVTYSHVAVEVWTEGYAVAWADIQEQYPDMAPRNLGNIGYSGDSGLFVPSAVRSSALETEGLSLEFYRSYNASWHQPGRYFASPRDLNTSTLLPCVNTSLMTPNTMKVYLEVSGDLNGTVQLDPGAPDVVVGRCFDTYFWYSPACRMDPLLCVACLTGGIGWSIHEIMTKAAAHNMPIAIAVANTLENYARIPNGLDLLLYWWVPDATFLRLQPWQISFPAHDPEAVARGDISSASISISIDKHVSQDLTLLAPDVLELIERFTVTLKSMNEMMLNQLDTGDDSFDIACHWLKGNEPKWSLWLPNTGKCNPQFGIYDDTGGKFLASRVDRTTSCRACPSGSFSSKLRDSQGVTYVCKECPSGHFQGSGAAVACNPCPVGTYQNETSSASCLRCPLGQYQDEEGKVACKLCPAGATTRLLGSLSFSDCYCNAGWINAGGPGYDTFNCVRCGEGMDCPFASSLATLLSGEALPQLGSEFVPSIVKGYFASIVEPFQIFHCRSQAKCPGGIPGTCAKGLKGEPCTACGAGQTWQNEECADCGSIALAWVAAVLCVLAGLYAAYFLANLEVEVRPAPHKIAGMLAGVTLNALQTLAVLGLMSVKWPATFAATASGVQILVLDFDSLGSSCLLGTGALRSYLSSVLAFPGALVWVTLCHLLCRWLKRWISARKWPYTFNTMGLTLQMGYSTMAAVALKPIMCYRHPNGLYSMVSYANVFCGEQEHGLMLGFGMALLVSLVLGFVALCSYATWNMPHWSASGQAGRVQSFRFCTSKFRLDVYWFVVFTYLRDLGFALAVALGTNLPPAQRLVASLVMMVYCIAQSTMRPWKVPLLNLVDITVTGIFVLLLGQAIQADLEMEQEFAEFATVCLLLLMLIGFILSGFFAGLAILLYSAGCRWSYILDLASAGKSDEIADVLQECAKNLLEIDLSRLSSQIENMNCYDVTNLVNFISLISTELQLLELSGGHFQLRVGLNSLNQRLSNRRTRMPSVRQTSASLRSVSQPSAVPCSFEEDMGDLSVPAERFGHCDVDDLWQSQPI